jgi:hypothetical protein
MNRTELLALHRETCSKAQAIMEAKSNDYNGGEHATDALANFKCATALGLHPVTGLLLRVQDKLMRIRSFVADGALRVTGETVEDACDDLLNYAILCKALLREEAAAQSGAVVQGETRDDNYECPCGRRLVRHYTRGWICEDCDCPP